MRTGFAAPLFLIILTCFGDGLSSALAQDAAATAVTQRLASTNTERLIFESDVAPILKQNCVRCHGGEVQKAELDLRTFESIKEGGESGPAIVKSNVEDSLLFEMIRDEAMPPEGDPLTKTDMETIRRWIESGTHSLADSAHQSTYAQLTQHDVVPIILRRCTMCHGPEYQEGQLDLRSKSTMLAGGKSGPAMVSGRPAESLMIRRIRAREMPPAESFGQAGIEPVTDEELATLEEWIALGAPEIPVQTDNAMTEPDSLVTDEDRQFWSFQAPRPMKPPQVINADLVRTPVDQFLLARLEQSGLTYSPEADRLTLLRRASFDLTGLPPDPDEVQRYLADEDPQAYEDLVDRLLQSPRYGERWGRYWLDLVGYADSEGKRQADMIRPYAYRYRDYVIRSFNRDTSYDKFLLDQIAGDELVDYSDHLAVTPDTVEKLVATGFLRMAPDGTTANPVNRVIDRVEVMADEIDILTRGVMGLTMKCARCHSHKYDPIPQRDYYRFVAIFKGAYDEYNWMTPQKFNNQWSKSKQRLLTIASTDEQRRWQAASADIQAEIQSLKVELQQLQAEKVSTNLTQTRANEVKKQIASLTNQLKEEPKIRALWDRGRPSPTYIYRRGDPAQPTRLVGPGVPSVLTSGSTPYVPEAAAAGSKKTGRRLALARWLTRSDHPLTARVLVNRVWKHHFGTGIVKSLDNFGRTGTPPSHPELLDWLALQFVQDGWSIKSLHRIMMTSSAYRQSSAIPAERMVADPEIRLLSRMPMRRMDAEEVRDSILLVAGRLNERPFGRPDSVDVRDDGLITSLVSGGGWRRSIYVRQRRKEMPTILETFDLPQMNPNCLERINSTVVSQPLHLLNNEMIHNLAGHFGKRILSEVGLNPQAQVHQAYLIALGRPPSNEERNISAQALLELTRHWHHEMTTNPAEFSTSAREHALADFCHSLVNSAAFLYID